MPRVPQVRNGCKLQLRCKEGSVEAIAKLLGYEMPLSEAGIATEAIEVREEGNRQ